MANKILFVAFVAVQYMLLETSFYRRGFNLVFSLTHGRIVTVGMLINCRVPSSGTHTFRLANILI